MKSMLHSIKMKLGQTDRIVGKGLSYTQLTQVLSLTSQMVPQHY